MTYWVTCTYKGYTIHGAMYYYDKLEAMKAYLRCVFRGDTHVKLWCSDYLHPENNFDIWASPVPVSDPNLPF